MFLPKKAVRFCKRINLLSRSMNYIKKICILWQIKQGVIINPLINKRSVYGKVFILFYDNPLFWKLKSFKFVIKARFLHTVFISFPRLAVADIANKMIDAVSACGRPTNQIKTVSLPKRNALKTILYLCVKKEKPNRHKVVRFRFLLVDRSNMYPNRRTKNRTLIRVPFSFRLYNWR